MLSGITECQHSAVKLKTAYANLSTNGNLGEIGRVMFIAMNRKTNVRQVSQNFSYMLF
jgi:hypothetical protein